MEIQPDEKAPTNVEDFQAVLSEDETHLNDLKKNGNVHHWKREVYKLLNGERESKFPSPFGSYSDYINSLIISSHDKISAKLFFIDALNKVISEITFDSCSSAQSNILLSLIITFRPENGFAELANYLREGGKFEEKYHPVGTYISSDIHQRALVALRVYYRVAPQDPGTPAFRTYVGILHQHLAHSNYRGFVVKELIKLELLRPGTMEMREILTKHPDVIEALLPFLASEERRLYDKSDLKNLAVDCFLIEPSEPFKKFNDALQQLEEHVQYASFDDIDFTNKNVLVAIDFEDGRYEFGFSEDEYKLFSKRMNELNSEYLIETENILKDDTMPQTRKEQALTAYFGQSIALGNETLSMFVKKLDEMDAQIVLENPNYLAIKYKNFEIPLTYEKNKVEQFCLWQMQNTYAIDRMENIYNTHERYFNAMDA